MKQYYKDHYNDASLTVKNQVDLPSGEGKTVEKMGF